MAGLKSEIGQRTTKTGEGSKLTLWGKKRRSTVAATTKNKKTTNTTHHAPKQAQRRREKGRSSPCGEVEDLRIRDQEHCKQRTKGQGNQKIHKVKRIALLGSWEGERSTRGEGKASQHAPFLSKTEPMLKITKKKRKEQQMWLRTAKRKTNEANKQKARVRGGSERARTTHRLRESREQRQGTRTKTKTNENGTKKNEDCKKNEQDGHKQKKGWVARGCSRYEELCLFLVHYRLDSDKNSPVFDVD